MSQRHPDPSPDHAVHRKGLSVVNEGGGGREDAFRGKPARVLWLPRLGGTLSIRVREEANDVLAEPGETAF